jgi:hypothetical protein
MQRTDLKKLDDHTNSLQVPVYVLCLELFVALASGVGSGIMERTDLDEVNDLLDEWFRGEGAGMSCQYLVTLPV